MWAKQKPVLDRECILLTLYKGYLRVFRNWKQENDKIIIRDLNDDWVYYSCLNADYYCILDYPNQSERSET